MRADRRGEGLGRALLEAAVAHARTVGLTLLWLTTHVETDAEAIYERLGWTRAGSFPNWAERPDGSLAANSLWYLELE